MPAIKVSTLCSRVQWTPGDLQPRPIVSSGYCADLVRSRLLCRVLVMAVEVLLLLEPPLIVRCYFILTTAIVRRKIGIVTYSFNHSPTNSLTHSVCWEHRSSTKVLHCCLFMAGFSMSLPLSPVSCLSHSVSVCLCQVFCGPPLRLFSGGIPAVA